MKRTVTIILLVISVCSSLFAAYPDRGYRGFVEQNIEVGWETRYYDGSSTFALWGLSTSHGYQFSPHFFLGAGVMFQIGSGNVMRRLELPLFVHAHTDWKFGKHPVFGDLRVGGTFMGRDMKGGEDKLQITPSVGYRWDWGRRTCANISIGVGLHGCDDSGWRTHFTWHPMPLLRFGIEF